MNHRQWGNHLITTGILDELGMSLPRILSFCALLNKAPSIIGFNTNGRICKNMQVSPRQTIITVNNRSHFGESSN